MTSYKPTITKQCVCCGKDFITTKTDKQTCSAKCINVMVYRAKRKPMVTHTCKWCSTEFESNRKNASFCCKKCLQAYGNEQIRLGRQDKFENVDDDQIPVCKICGWKAYELYSHIRNYHKMPIDEYTKQYNITNVFELIHPDRYNNKQTRMVGENNPGYQHNGTRSSFSKKSNKYQGLSDDQVTELIYNQITKANATKRTNKSYTTTIEYWINEGYPEPLAAMKVKERQQTFSLAKCIEKYGEVGGRKRWKLRQDRWRASLALLSDEQRADMIRRSVKHSRDTRYERQHASGSSRIGDEMFDHVSKLSNIPILFGAQEFAIDTERGCVFVDCFDPKTNRVIEFFGTLWHASGIHYMPNDTIPIVEQTAENIWERDKRRIDELIELGYEVLVVWEHDYRQRPLQTVELCVEFLRNGFTEKTKN